MVKYIFGGLAAATFGLFFTNVMTGRLRGESFLTDVQEFLTLAIACLFLVLMFLAFERSTQSIKQE